MENILRANEDSNVEKIETSMATVDLSYSIKKPYPDLAKAYDEITPLLTFPSGSPFSGQQTFFIPAGYYVPLVRLKMLYKRTLSEVDECTSKTAIDMIQSLQIQSNGQTIFETTSEGLFALYNQMEPSVRAYIYRYARQLLETTEKPPNTTAVDTPCVSYLPIYTSWFSGVYQSAINTTKVDNLTIVIRYNSQATTGSINDMTQFTSKLQVNRYKPNTKLYDEIVSKDYSGSLKMPCFNVMVETQPILQSAHVATTMNEISFQSNCFFNVLKTYIFIKQSNMSNTQVPAANTVYGRPLQEITDVSVTMGGSPWITSFKKSMLDFEVALGGRSTGCFETIDSITNGAINRAITVSDSIIEPIVINYGALSGETNTGLAFFKQLSKPTFKVKWNYVPYQTGAYSTDYTLYFVHVYENILGIEGNNAKIVVNN